MALRGIGSGLKSILSKSRPVVRSLPCRVSSGRVFSSSSSGYDYGFQSTTLSNGFRVATIPTNDKTATVGVWIDAGSSFENKENNGVAHFLEHMAFKGTSRRSQYGLELEVENMGGQLNAYTSREQTVYYARVLANDVPQAVDLIGDILQNSTFDKNAIERERGTILREMEEVETQTDETIFDHLHSVAYQGTSLGRTILGPEENVKSITRDDLVKYIKTHYTGPRMVLTATGGVNHKDLVALAEKHFGSLDGKLNYDLSSLKNVPFTGSQVNINDEAMSETHIAVAFEGAGWNNKSHQAFMLLQTLLGNWDRTIGGGKHLVSRLCEEVAQDNLAHSLMTFNTVYHHTGLFGVYAVAPPKNIHDLLKTILGQMLALCENVSETELDIAKNKLISTLFMQLDGTANLAEDVGRQMLTFGTWKDPRKLAYEISQITPEDVKAVAKKHIYDCEPALAAIGQTSYVPDYINIRRWTTRFAL